MLKLRTFSIDYNCHPTCTLSIYKASQHLLLLLNIDCLAEEQQILIITKFPTPLLFQLFYYENTVDGQQFHQIEQSPQPIEHKNRPRIETLKISVVFYVHLHYLERGVVVVIVWYVDLQLHMQPITTDVLSSNLDQG